MNTWNTNYKFWSRAVATLSLAALIGGGVLFRNGIKDDREAKKQEKAGDPIAQFDAECAAAGNKGIGGGLGVVGAAGLIFARYLRKQGQGY